MVRAKGSGKIQQFILAETKQWAEELAGMQHWALSVATLTWRYVNQGTQPGDPNRREFTPSEYEAVRRAAKNLFNANQLDIEPIRYRDGQMSWGYVYKFDDDDDDPDTDHEPTTISEALGPEKIAILMEAVRESRMRPGTGVPET